MGHTLHVCPLIRGKMTFHYYWPALLKETAACIRTALPNRGINTAAADYVSPSAVRCRSLIVSLRSAIDIPPFVVLRPGSGGWRPNCPKRFIVVIVMSFLFDVSPESRCSSFFPDAGCEEDVQGCSECRALPSNLDKLTDWRTNRMLTLDKYNYDCFRSMLLFGKLDQVPVGKATTG